MHRPVAACYESLRETTDIEPFDTLFAIIATAEELDAGLRVVGI